MNATGGAFIEYPLSSPSVSQRVLLTGAFGGIGQEALRHLLANGHSVNCMDLPNPKNKKAARQFSDRVNVIWGDICNLDTLGHTLQGIDVVIHMAAVLPPLANMDIARATVVNVEATRHLITLMEGSVTAKRLIFASSIGIAGKAQHLRTPPLTVEEPPAPSDHYGMTKAQCETLIKASAIDWTILRIAACPHAGLLKGNLDAFRLIFDTSADGRVEFVHFDDAGLAFANAVSCNETIGKTLFIGGGARCQTNAWSFYNSLFREMGLGPLPRAAFCPGQPLFFGDWLDTRESQELLKFQHHSLEEFYVWLRTHMGLKRYFFRALSPLINRVLLRQSPYLQTEASGKK